jgi:hypothetical protein
MTTIDATTVAPLQDTGTADRILLGAASLFALAVLVHNSDHLRRGADSIGRDVLWAGTAAVLVEVAAVVLACQRHRLAPLAAVTIGWSLAPAYVLVHFLPARSWLSDSFVSASSVSPLSWFAASFEVVAALALGLAGWMVLRRRGGLASAAQPYRAERPLTTALLHPLALAMLAGNVVILVLTMAQL